ncbi:hypothetical protein INT45_008442 [Circinella minor]|uniref:Uncharacterized protein n=1 Tax=Circinella minor TaxID=1195481 RepID=A0A8H7VSJ2_9FUNG|nr:hypothetical protein INT45_008442 [Circinella minor]
MKIQTTLLILGLAVTAYAQTDDNNTGDSTEQGVDSTITQDQQGDNNAQTTETGTELNTGAGADTGPDAETSAGADTGSDAETSAGTDTGSDADSSADAATPTTDPSAAQGADTAAATEQPELNTSIPDIDWWSTLASDASGIPTDIPSSSDLPEQASSALGDLSSAALPSPSSFAPIASSPGNPPMISSLPSSSGSLPPPSSLPDSAASKVQAGGAVSAALAMAFTWFYMF